MHNISKTLSIGLLALAMAPGCKGKTGTTDPGKGGPGLAANAKGAAGGKVTKEAKEDFAKAVAAYKKAKSDGKLSDGECESSAKAFLDVFKEHGKPMVAAYFNAGAVWDECGKLDRAEKIYLDVTKADPSYDLAWNNLGVIYWKNGQDKKALDTFRKGVDANKLGARAARNNVAGLARNVFVKNLDAAAFAEAEGEIQRVLALDSSNQAAYENLARLYYDRGVLKDKSYLVLANLVVTQSNRVLKEEGRESAEINNITGLLLMQRDDQVNALKAFKEAVRINPDHPEANLNIAFISIRFRDYATAEKSLRIAMRNKEVTKDIEAHIALGVALRGLKKYPESEKAYAAASKLDPRDPRPWYNLAVLNQMHLATADGIDEEGTKKYFNIAKKHYGKFMELAGSKKDFQVAVLEAQDSIATIDETFEFFKIQKELEAKAKEMEALQKKQEDAERKRLMDLEKRAMEAAAKAEAAAAGGGDAPPAGGAK
ncbi:MAG: tetratricopeptide repeat protein [Nannocystaceae bacterium]|nr:tetratricopeptide repeat protein [Myxococcales bacterium]